MKAREFKRIWGKPWDFGYLLKLEQYKIREMRDYIQKYHTHLRWEDQVREMILFSSDVIDGFRSCACNSTG